MSSSFRLVYWIWLDLIGPSSQTSKHLCIFGLYGVKSTLSVFFKIILTSLYLVERSWCGGIGPLPGGLTKCCPSVWYGIVGFNVPIDTL